MEIKEKQAEDYLARRYFFEIFSMISHRDIKRLSHLSNFVGAAEALYFVVLILYSSYVY